MPRLFYCTLAFTENFLFMQIHFFNIFNYAFAYSADIFLEAENILIFKNFSFHNKICERFLNGFC